MTGQDVDWKAMARLPQFKGKADFISIDREKRTPAGATSHYLQCQYNSAVRNAMMKLEMRREEVTGLTLQAWLQDSERRERSSVVREKEERVVQIFVSLLANSRGANL